jgi:hypothetical protein
MALGLAWGLATFRMLGTVSMLQRDRSFARHRGRLGLGSDGVDRRRITFNDGIVCVCFLVLVGLVVLGSLLMLLSWVTATLPPSMLRSCPEFDVCGPPVLDRNESLSVDDPLTDGLRMTH